MKLLAWFKKKKKFVRSILNAEYYLDNHPDCDVRYTISRSDWNIYDTKTNTFRPLPKNTLIIGRDNYFPCAKEAYLKHTVNTLCDCELGTGRNIVVADKPYDVVKVLNDYYTGKYYVTAALHTEYDVYDVNTNKMVGSVDLYFRNYFKKACLNCHTCLDEKSSLLREFDKKLKESISNRAKEAAIKKRRAEELEMVEKICGND